MLIVGSIAAAAFGIGQPISATAPLPIILGNNESNIKVATPSIILGGNESITLNSRESNITQVISKTSGDSLSEQNSPQNIARKWRIHEDEMNLSYNSSNLVQRYCHGNLS